MKNTLQYFVRPPRIRPPYKFLYKSLTSPHDYNLHTPMMQMD